MATKHKVKKVKGIKVVEKIEGEKERQLVPRPAVFKDGKEYDRKKDKQALRKEAQEDIR